MYQVIQTDKLIDLFHSYRSFGKDILYTESLNEAKCTAIKKVEEIAVNFHIKIVDHNNQIVFLIEKVTK